MDSCHLVHHAAILLQYCESRVREDCQIQGANFRMPGNTEAKGKHGALTLL